MDTVSFISDCLAQVQKRLLATCEGLTPEQLNWRPAATANNIGFVLWHVARNEDTRITETGHLGQDVWSAAKWHEKFGQPVEAPDPGDRLGMRTLAIPELGTLIGYSEAVHQRTQDFLSQLNNNGLDRVYDTSRPEQPVAVSLRHLITHKNNHHGQVDYLRGLQQEDWDLPRGTGVVLPGS